MQIVRVSFFSELSVQSLTRRVFLPRVKRQALDTLICQMMQGPEFLPVTMRPMAVSWH